MKTTYYLCGPVSQKPNYTAEFRKAEALLSASKDHIIINPAKLPHGMDEDRYLPICMAMIDQADEILVLDGWERSLGCFAEISYALRQGKHVTCFWDGSEISFFPGVGLLRTRAKEARV